MMSQEEWRHITSADKEAPSWLQVWQKHEKVIVSYHGYLEMDSAL